jgi:hypothetical protein
MEEQGEIMMDDYGDEMMGDAEDHIVQQHRIHGMMPSEGREFCRSPNGYPVSRDWADVDCWANCCRWNHLDKCMVPSHCKIGADGKCGGFEFWHNHF